MNIKSSLLLMLTRRSRLNGGGCLSRKSCGDMAPETVDSAVDFLFTSPSRRLELRFAGGEPFLRLDLIKRAALRARTLARRRHREISFCAVTGGLCLTPEAISFLREMEIAPEVSLSGEKGMRGRLGKTRAKGFSACSGVLAAIQALLDAGVPCSVRMVRSPDEAARLCEDFGHLLGLGVRDFEIICASGVLWSEEALRVMEREFARLCLRHRRELKSGKLRLDSLNGLPEPAPLKSDLLVHPDGTLHCAGEPLFGLRGKSAPLGDIFGGADMRRIHLSRAVCHYLLLKSCGNSDSMRAVVRNNVAAAHEFARFAGVMRGAVFGDGRWRGPLEHGV